MKIDTKQETAHQWPNYVSHHWPRRTKALVYISISALCLLLSTHLFRGYPQSLHQSSTTTTAISHDHARVSTQQPSLQTQSRPTSTSESFKSPATATPTTDPHAKTIPTPTPIEMPAHVPDMQQAEASRQQSDPTQKADTKPAQTPETSISVDPISQLIEDAQRQQKALLEKQTFTLPYAASAYRARRGRHPPPHFDAWYQYAKDRDVVMVEEFWDLIYHDLKPFWAIDQGRLKRQAASGASIRIRDGRVAWTHNFFWCNLTSELIGKFVKFLPDLDIAMNLMDEPRVVVPWEDVNGYIKKEGQLRSGALDVPLGDVKREYSKQTVSTINGNDSPDKTESMQKGWLSYTNTDRFYWPIVVQGCPPNSPSRLAYEAQKARGLGNSSDIPARPLDVINIEALSKRVYAKQGFIRNYTGLVDLCEQPEVGFLHGGLVNPLTTSHRGDLLPIFGGSKMSVHNDITIPAPMHYAHADLFEDVNRDESKKTDDVWPHMLEEIMWRGVTSGGRVTAKNWKAFHRHRFLALTNPDQLELYDQGHTRPDNWMILDDMSLRPIQQAHMQAAVSRAAMDHALNETFRYHLLAAFTTDPCTELTIDPETKDCPVGRTIQLGDRLSLRDQFQHKYLPDVDGNSYSGRFRAFLLSDAVPIKATIYREWFDHRIIPWIHFVPMSNSFHEFYAIMEYFFGYKAKGGEILPAHDEMAKLIAKSGREWSEKVIRREDQEVYMFRLLLEFARVLEDDRDRLGYVDDLL